MEVEPKLKEKAWDKGLEKAIYENWKKSKTYSFNPETKKEIYSIDTPPPYVNAPVHMGHGTTYILMDMFARFRRMKGFEVLFPLGLDRNGLPIEVATEKKFDVTPWKVPREEFISYCKKLLEEFSTKSTETFLRSGISFSSWEPGIKPGDLYFTDSDEYRALTQSTFIDLWNAGLIKLDNRVNNYCPKCQTTIADAEIDYNEEQTFFNHIKFKIKETEKYIVIGTTRPELLSTCGVILFNPEDSRYKSLEGKTAITPIYGKEVPIKAHPYAKIDAGTGLVMMCSFGDYTDIRFFREEGLQHTIAIDRLGKMTKVSGFLEGLKVADARKKVIEELGARGLLVKQEKVQHRQPICERSKTPIEFIDMEEYYLKQLDFVGDVRKVSDEISFYSEKNKKILTDWISAVSIDWPISRRRIYATEIPLWYCKCGKTIVPPKGKYYKPWKEDPPVKCTCGSSEYKGEERVFDTWFDSSISPLYILGYDNELFKKAFPASLRPQGKEIVRTWLYYTLLRCYQLTKKPAFKDVWIHNHILDGKGRKMSKSLGNVVDPAKLLDTFGAEPIRLWSVLEGNLVDGDFICSEDRIKGAGKFLTKFWNVARFISSFENPGSNATEPLDKWILDQANLLVAEANEYYARYDFHNPTVNIRHFVWEIFASHYMEIVKPRAYAGDKSALSTLYRVLEICLKLLAPVTPFITHKVYMEVFGKDIHSEAFPEAGEIGGQDFIASELMDLDSSIWKSKKENGLSLISEIESFDVPKKFKSIESDIRLGHKIKEIRWI